MFQGLALDPVSECPGSGRLRRLYFPNSGLGIALAPVLEIISFLSAGP